MNRIILNLAAVLFVLGALIFPDETYAQTPPIGIPAGGIELGGYAWSSTIGWISMNCANTASCLTDGGYDYSVTLDASGALLGYAWSPNIGWIKFGGLDANATAFPVGSDTTSVNARTAGTYPNLTFEGWARACAGAADVTACTGGTNSGAGGWDGWISLQGTNHSIETDTDGVVGSGNDGLSNHWAWGSAVVGWIDFSPTLFGVSNEPVILSFTANPSTVMTGTPSTLEWQVINTDSCTASNDQSSPEWSGSVASTNGTHSQTVNPAVTTEYVLECVNAFGTVTRTVDVTTSATAITGLTPIGINPDECHLTDITPTPATTGVCDPINVSMVVRNDTGLDLVATDLFPYEFEYRETNPNGAWQSADAGVFSGTIPAGGSFIVNGTVIGLPTVTGLPEFGSYEVRGLIDGGTISAPLTVDPYPETTPPPPPVPTVNIGPGGNYGTFSIFTGPGGTQQDLIRSGTVVPVSWRVNSPLPLACTVAGPGVNQSFTHDPGISLVTDSTAAPVDSSVLANASTFTLRCTPQTFNRFVPNASLSYIAETSVDVVPTFQEI